MQSSYSINLLILTGICFLEIHASSDVCSGNHYTVTDADGKFIECQSCDRCHEGYGLEPKCGSSVQSPVVNVSCEPCPTGTFSNKYDSGPCYQCQVCDEHQVVISYCNSQADTNCSQTCESGYYFARDVSHACHKCSYCCDDGNDDEQLDCVKQGLKKRNQHCSHRVDKDCAPDLSSDTDISSPSSNHGKKQLDLGTTLAIIFGALAGVAVVILVICAIWKRRQSSDQGQISPPAAQGQETAMIDIAQEENGNISQESPTIGSTPRPSAVSRLSNLNPGFVPSNPGTPNVTPQHTDDELDPESDHPNRRRKLMLRKKSNSHTSKGQIKIVQHPKSQTLREGSRLEVTCECQVQGNCEVWYQWLQDGTVLQGQNNASLVLDSVKMRDFGCYRCCITPRGSHGEAVTSEPALLEVFPCEGKRLKYLREVDLDTRDEIATLLEDETPGLGGYRKIAANYGMEEHLVRGLKNSRQPGQDVMEFLRGSNTNLTVYSFCKKLKEDKMKRFDIVGVLEDHLSIESK